MPRKTVRPAKSTRRKIAHPADARRLLMQAYAQLMAADDRAGCLTAWAGICETFFLEWDDFTGLDRWIAEIERLLPTFSEFPDPQVEASVLAGATAMALRRPGHPALQRWATRALELLPTLTDPSERVRIAGWTVTVWYGRGDVERAIKAWTLADGERLGPGPAPLHLIHLRLQVGALFLQRFEPAEARRHFNAALDLAETTGEHRLDTLAHVRSAYALLALGDSPAASLHADLAAQAARGRAVDDTHSRFLRAGILLMNGDTCAALAIISPELPVADGGCPFSANLLRVQAGQILMLAGLHGEARELLRLALAFAAQAGSDLLTFHAGLNLAWSLFDTGRDEQALAELQHAFAVGRRRAYLGGPPYWLPRVMSRLCTRALAAGVETEYVTYVVRTRGVLPDCHASDDWPWPVRVYALGRFCVALDGKPLAFGGKAQAKPLELLQAVVAHGERGVSADALTEALWPEAEGDAGRRSFDITLHRLRKLLKREDAIALAEGKVSLAPAVVRTDVQAFQALAKRIEAANGSYEDTGVQVLAAQLLARYPGEFLAQERVRQWALPRRERLRAAFQRAALALGTHHEQQGRWPAAADFYRAAIERDPVAEAFYQQLMRCLGRLGLAAEVARTYRSLKAELARSLGIAPSPRSKAICSEYAARTEAWKSGAASRYA